MITNIDAIIQLLNGLKSKSSLNEIEAVRLLGLMENLRLEIELKEQRERFKEQRERGLRLLSSMTEEFNNLIAFQESELYPTLVSIDFYELSNIAFDIKTNQDISARIISAMIEARSKSIEYGIKLEETMFNVSEDYKIINHIFQQ